MDLFDDTGAKVRAIDEKNRHRLEGGFEEVCLRGDYHILV